MLSTNCTSHNMFKVTIPSTFILREISRLLYQFFIDNITLILKDDSAIISIVQELQQYFKLYDLDPTSFLLLVQVKQDLEAHTILLSQSYYINELLKHFGMDDCNPVKTPLFFRNWPVWPCPNIFWTNWDEISTLSVSCGFFVISCNNNLTRYCLYCILPWKI